VVEAVTQVGGFSPGLAVRVLFANGRRVFVKAISAECNPESPAIYRAEAGFAAALPRAVPAPRLLGFWEVDGWVTLVFEDLDGHPPALPWQPAELDRVLAALAELSDILTPSPIPAPTIQTAFGAEFEGWRRLRAQPDRQPQVDAWAGDNLDLLADIEAAWPEAAAGDTLLHADIRADNILLTENRVVLVDWPWARIGAAWIDLLFMLPSVAMQGGPQPQEVFDAHPVARTADPDAVTSVLAAFAGFMMYGSTQPAPPGLPTLRSFQLAQGRAAVSWLQRRVA
jgi:hypothetical protein